MIRHTIKNQEGFTAYDFNVFLTEASNSLWQRRFYLGDLKYYTEENLKPGDVYQSETGLRRYTYLGNGLWEVFKTHLNTTVRITNLPKSIKLILLHNRKLLQHD